MAVLKNKTQGNYTIVSQNIMRDKNLSLTERGMLLTLLSLPDNWHLTIMGLCQILPDGKDKIAKTLNSLIDKGYVTRDQGRANGGKFDSTNLEVHETPIPVTKPPMQPKILTENPAPKMEIFRIPKIRIRYIRMQITRMRKICHNIILIYLIFIKILLRE